MARPVRILILGTGGMANNHAQKFKEIEGVTLVGGVDTRAEPLAAFCAKHGIERGFASLDEALDWGQFDAVSNVTPDAAHYATTLPVLKAGKHILCEKPLATNETHADEMAAAAKAAGVINMVNLSYRNVGALQQAAKMVREGAIGTLRHFEASYLQSWLTQPAWGHWDRETIWLWRLSTKHGSKGVLGDVGIHILDFALYAAGFLLSGDLPQGARRSDWRVSFGRQRQLHDAIGADKRGFGNGFGLAFRYRPSERSAAAALW